METSDLPEGENVYDVLDVVPTRSQENIYDSIVFDPGEVLSQKIHQQPRSFVSSTFHTRKTESLTLNEVVKQEMGMKPRHTASPVEAGGARSKPRGQKNNVVHIRKKTTGDEEKSGSPISRMKR